VRPQLVLDHNAFESLVFAANSILQLLAERREERGDLASAERFGAEHRLTFDGLAYPIEMGRRGMGVLAGLHDPRSFKARRHRASAERHQSRRTTTMPSVPFRTEITVAIRGTTVASASGHVGAADISYRRYPSNDRLTAYEIVTIE
jgi:hypothetical protein